MKFSTLFCWMAGASAFNGEKSFASQDEMAAMVKIISAMRTRDQETIFGAIEDRKD